MKKYKGPVLVMTCGMEMRTGGMMKSVGNVMNTTDMSNGAMRKYLFESIKFDFFSSLIPRSLSKKRMPAGMKKLKMKMGSIQK